MKRCHRSASKTTKKQVEKSNYAQLPAHEVEYEELWPSNHAQKTVIIKFWNQLSACYEDFFKSMNYAPGMLVPSYLFFKTVLITFVQEILNNSNMFCLLNQSAWYWEILTMEHGENKRQRITIFNNI